MLSVGDIVKKVQPSLFWCMRGIERSKREAIYTLFAFCRHLDNIVRSSMPLAEKMELLSAWQEELDRNTVVPTLKSAVPGDITFAIGYRTMTDILQFIKEMDKIIEGFAHPDNLLYGPEIKFYSNKVLINDKFETSIKGLYSIGDGGGMTRGLMMASASGIQMARNL